MSHVIDFLSYHPIYGIDNTSMEQWSLDCEKEWNILSNILLKSKDAMLFDTFIDAYNDLAKKASQQVFSSIVWSMDDRKKSVEYLLNAPQVEQRTESWYTEAQRMLTASQFSTILQTGRTRGHLVVEKALGNTDTSQRKTVVFTSDLNPFTWGIRFEPIVNQIYCHLTNTVVKDMGRLKHRTDTRLAASPDGMVISGPEERYGRFVEFKAPITRELIKIVPKDYIVQMQIQMEVGNVQECDYLEVKFISANGTKTPEIPEGTYYGELFVIGIDDTPKRYMYSPLNTKGWIPSLEPGEIIYETVPWVTNAFYLTTVGRSPSWFASVQPAIESFWKDVELARKGEFILPESSRKKKDIVCRIIDDNQL